MTAESERRSPPTGTVTFLFTDLEGSTELWDQKPKVMTEALAWHDKVLRRAISENEGYIFSTGGDGFGAAFADPMQGAAAAVAAQQAVSAKAWNGLGILRVRMGLDTGIAEERDGDYFGPPVNRAARIMALAEGGEVLTSHTFSDLLGHHLEEGIRLVDVGERQLKGVARPQVIFAVEYGPPEEEAVSGFPRGAAIAAGVGAAVLLIGVVLFLAGPFGASEEATQTADEPGPAGTSETAAVDPSDLAATGILAPEDVCPEGLERPASVDFTGTELAGAVLQCLDLSGAIFNGAGLQGTQFIGVDLTDASFTTVDMVHTNQGPPLWHAVRVDGVQVNGGWFQPRVENSDLRGMEIGITSLSIEIVDSIADGLDFSGGTELRVVNFNRGSGRGVNLAGLAVTSFETDLEGVDLSRALVGHMIGSSLVDADLSGARLGGVSFEGLAYVANFNDADLTGAIVTGVSIEPGIQWGNTICPDGSNSNENLGSCDLG